jgi:hypothetical protein
LTATEGAAAEGETTADAEGGRADAQRNGTHETKGVARQNAGVMQGDGAGGIEPTAETPSNNTKHAAVTVGTAVVAPSSSKAVAAPDGDVVHAPDKDVHATTNTGGLLEAMWRKGRMRLSLKPHRLPPAPLSTKPPPPPSLRAPRRPILRPPPPKPRS